jgi:predicted nucleotidyltransferase
LSIRFPELIKLKISAERFLKVLRDLGIEYVMIGGIPAGFYGLPRFTQDLDFTVDPVAAAENFAELIQRLETHHFQLVSGSLPTREELKKISSLRFIDTQNRTMIDLVLNPPGFRWDLDILKRRRKEKVLTRHMTVWVVPLEDMIVMKIANGKPQDLKDVEGILTRRFKEVDWNYLRMRARQFNVTKEVDEVHIRFSS